MALKALATSRQLAYTVLALLSIFGCDHGQRITKLERLLDGYMRKKDEKDKEQDTTIEDVASKIACDNADVRNFIKKCTSDEKCDNGEVVNAIRNMKKMDHVMLRIPYQHDGPLSIDAEDRKAQFFALLRTHQVVNGLTKVLVVAIPSLPKKTVKGKPPQNSKQGAAIEIDFTNLKNQARHFRNSLYEPEYNLSRTIKHLEPQVPRCDERSIGLVQILHKEVSADQLTAQEKAIQAPYVDLIIFLVEC